MDRLLQHSALYAGGNADRTVYHDSRRLCAFPDGYGRQGSDYEAFDCNKVFFRRPDPYLYGGQRAAFGQYALCAHDFRFF